MKGLALLALVVVSGCNLYFGPGEGGGGGGPGGGSIIEPDAGPMYVPDAQADPQAEFLTNVYPLLEANCIGCHVGPSPNLFTAPDPTTVYVDILDNISLNGCFSAFPARLTAKWIHEGPGWTPTQYDTISQWLSDQGLITGAIGPACPAPLSTLPAPADVVRAEFANCIPAAGAAALHATGADAIFTAATSAGTCVSCHGGTSTTGFALGANDAQLMKQLMVPLNPLLGQVPSPGGLAGTVTAFDIDDLLSLGTQAGNGAHPSFTLPSALIKAWSAYIDEVNALEDRPACVPVVMGNTPYPFQI